jgi:hypothetical protein
MNGLLRQAEALSSGQRATGLLMMVDDAPYAAVKRIDLDIEGAAFLIVKLDVRSPRSKVAPSGPRRGNP